MSSKLNYAIIPVTPFEQNCSVIWCAKTKLAAVTDPGGDLEKITQFIDDNDLKLEKILITHAHLDHCLLYTSPSPRDATLSRMPSSA